MTDSGDKLIENAVEHTTAYGKLFNNKEAQTNKLNTELQALLKDTQAIVKGKGNCLILLVNGSKISAFSSGYRLNWIHSDFGIPMADSSIKTAVRGQPIAFQFIQNSTQIGYSY